jgi:hypothetical protein
LTCVFLYLRSNYFNVLVTSRCEPRVGPCVVPRQLRQRYRKIYEDYRPQYKYWKVSLLMKKLLLTAIVVIVNSVQSQVGLPVSDLTDFSFF